MRLRLLLATGVFIALFSASHAFAISAPSEQFWMGDEYGSWSFADGVYDAALPSPRPPAYSSITGQDLTDFIVEVDVHALRDGGLFLRSQDLDNSVVLVTGGKGGSHDGLYWHVRRNGEYGEILNEVYIPELRGQDVSLKVEVTGDTYSAYINGETTPITTLTTSAFSSGGAALYDYDALQSFSNLFLTLVTPQTVPPPPLEDGYNGFPGNENGNHAVPEPASGAMLAAAGAAIAGLSLKRRRS